MVDIKINPTKLFIFYESPSLVEISISWVGEWAPQILFFNFLFFIFLFSIFQNLIFCGELETSNSAHIVWDK